MEIMACLDHPVLDNPTVVFSLSIAPMCSLTLQNLLTLKGVAVQQRPWLAILPFMQYGSLRDVLRVMPRCSFALTVALCIGPTSPLCPTSPLVSALKIIVLSNRRFVGCSLSLIFLYLCQTLSVSLSLVLNCRPVRSVVSR